MEAGHLGIDEPGIHLEVCLVHDELGNDVLTGYLGRGGEEATHLVFNRVS